MDEELNEDSAREVMRNMLDQIEHRGPDASHIWQSEATTLGHNRLSIIDLSSAADQPMIFEHLVLTFNGEIYNYVEIKKELLGLGHQFSTESDSEVLLHAYYEWGAKAVRKFIGMWAFAIWDRKDKTLFCSRDRFGIKPFYFIHQGSAFYFASEQKALKLSRLFNAKLNENHLMRYLQVGWLSYEDETIFEHVHALRGGENLVFQEGKITRERYWSAQDLNRDKISISFEDAVEEFRQRFLNSVDLHLRSDVPVGVCLSGGIDSSSIVSAMAAQSPESKIHSFTAYYTGKLGVDERPWAQKVLDKYPSIEPHFYSPKDDELEDAVEKMMFHMDVPLGGSSPISQYFVMKLVRENGIKVVLDGQGSDEYLAGYMHSYYSRIGSLLSQGKLFPALKLFGGHYSEHLGSLKAASKTLASASAAAVMNQQQWHKLEYRRRDMSLFSDKQHVPFTLQDHTSDRFANHLITLTLSTTLPTLLHYEDRNSMAFSIESRVPFLNHELVEFAFSLPNDFKLTKTTKLLLRESMKGIIPDAIRTRKDKKGFVTPGETKWLRGPLKHLVKSDALDYSFIDHSAIRSLFDEYNSGNNAHSKQVWKVAMLNKWLKTL